MSAPPDVESAVRAVIHAMYCGNLEALKLVAVPNPNLHLLVQNRQPVVGLNDKVRDIQMHVIATQPDGRIIVHVYFMGVIMPMTLVPGGEGGAWKADLRWWLCAFMPPRDLDRAARAFMFAIISGDEELLAHVALPHPDRALLTANPAPSGELGQYENVCENMPMTELVEGETYPWPVEGERKVGLNDINDTRRVLMGQFGGSEIVFIMRNVSGKWKVDPTPFIIASMMR